MQNANPMRWNRGSPPLAMAMPPMLCERVKQIQAMQTAELHGRKCIVGETHMGMRAR